MFDVKEWCNRALLLGFKGEGGGSDESSFCRGLFLFLSFISLSLIKKFILKSES